MFNPYFIILFLFVVAGVMATAWGLVIIIKARKTRHWPAVEGVIEESVVSSDANDLLPYIRYRYSVAERIFQRSIEFPADITPTQEFAEHYVKKYPVGANIQVYYNPDNPEQASLEQGVGQGDWLVFVIGLGMLIFGLLSLFFSG
ncbi:DUF3592 domain-containing protein [Kaarinaea lacus]